jgi:hypothetical protein
MGMNDHPKLTDNAKIFRTEMSELLKYLISGMLAIGVVIAYFAAALILSFTINN